MAQSNKGHRKMRGQKTHWYGHKHVPVIKPRIKHPLNYILKKSTGYTIKKKKAPYQIKGYTIKKPKIRQPRLNVRPYL